MDPLTQGLLGAATAQLGFRQHIGRGATFVAAITAMLADLDVALLMFNGSRAREFAMLEHHRGLSHSLFMVPAIALITAVPWWLWRKYHAPPPPASVRKIITDRVSHPEAVAVETAAAPAPGAPTFCMLYACTLIAALSHPLLDFCTTYGTQLLAPLTDTRFALNVIPIVDLIYTPILLLTLLACGAVRLLRGGRAPLATLVLGWLGMFCSVAYLGGGYLMRNLATEKARLLANNVLADGAGPPTIIDAKAYPYLGSIFLWRTVVETQDSWLAAGIRPLHPQASAVLRHESVAKMDHTLIRRALRMADVRKFAWFAGGQLRSVYRKQGPLHVVEFHDMRYGRGLASLEGMWSVRLTFDWRGRVVDPPKKIHNFRGKGSGDMLMEIWRDIRSP